MKDHELKVKHIASGKEMIVSKAYYHNAPDEYEVIDGEAGGVAEKATYTPPAPPKMDDKPKANKQDKAVTKNKAAPVPAPSV